MIARLLLAAVLLVTVAGCGVKSELEKPNGQPTQQHEKDNSKPSSPIGR